jgi:hypothetical protein
MTDQDMDLDALDAQLRLRVAPESAFLMATDHGARHDPGPHVVLDIASHLWLVLTSGFAGVLLKEALKEFGKTAAGEAGKALAQAGIERLKRWSAGPPPMQDDEQKRRALIGEADQLLKEGTEKLEAAARKTAMAAGEAALEQYLAQERQFTASRARRLAASLRELAEARHDAA